ncbi:MAG: hypothetical protein E4H36_11965, partial [Spirochaetales bacterium]
MDGRRSLFCFQGPYKRIIMKRAPVLTFLFLLIASIGSAQDLAGQVVKVRIEPEVLSAGETAVLRAEYSIPEGMYMALQEQFFFVRIDDVDGSGIPGLVQKPLVYPPGVEKGGLITYKKSVVLNREFTLPADLSPGSYTLKVTAGYQYCNEEGTCYIPKTVTFNPDITVIPAAGAGSAVPGVLPAAAGT